MQSFALFSLLCALAAHAAPAPMPQESAQTAPSADMSKHLSCSDDGTQWYNGDQLTDCPPGTICQGTAPCVHDDASGGTANGGVADPSVGTGGDAQPSTVETGSNGDEVTSAAAPGISDYANNKAVDNPVPTQSDGSGAAPSDVANLGSGSLGSGASATVSGDTKPIPTTYDKAAEGLTGKFTMTGPECPGQKGSDEFRYIGYWGQFYEGTVTPTAEQMDGLTHLILSFATTDDNEGLPGPNWAMVNIEDKAPPWFNDATVPSIRAVNKDVKLLAAFGGWDQDVEFENAAKAGSMEAMAHKMVEFAHRYDLDGIDLDWEYPVGNSARYMENGVEKPADPSEMDAYLDLMRLIRAKDKDLILSVAVPAITKDQLAFTEENIPVMDKCLDFWNVMTYDYVNRRADKSGYHAGGKVIEAALGDYEGKGLDPRKMNFGIPTYAKYYTPLGECDPSNPVGCALAEMEDESGESNGKSGDYKWNNITNDQSPSPPWSSADRMLAVYDQSSNNDAMSSIWMDTDAAEKWIWSWMSAKDVANACKAHSSHAGGVFYWSMNGDFDGKDGGDITKAMAQCAKEAGGGGSGGGGGNGDGGGDVGGEGGGDE